MEVADAKLASGCLAGDPHAWETLVQLYSRRVYNMAYRYLGRFDLAEELTQEIFLKIFQNLGSFRPESGALRNWIMRVGRNLIIDYCRTTRHERRVAGSDELEVFDFECEVPRANPFENLFLKEKSERIREGMRNLTPELREAVLLRDIEGLTYQEIADLLVIPEGTVKSRINRGRIELARALRKNRAVEADLH